jgi:type I restriction enzyme M protein
MRLGEIKNKISSGYNLREIIDHIDELRFRSQTEKHELSHLYEAKIKNMGNAGRNGGEYYTPRPMAALKKSLLHEAVTGQL